MKRTDAIPTRLPRPSLPLRHERVTRAVRFGFHAANRDRIAHLFEGRGRGSETAAGDTVQDQPGIRVLERQRTRAPGEDER